MRVAMVSLHANPLGTPGDGFGCAQRVHVAALSAALARRGTEVTVYTRRTAPDTPSVLSAAEGYSVVHVPAGPPAPVGRDGVPACVPEFGRRLREFLDDDPPDVIHAHSWTSAVAATSGRAGDGPPVVVTFHSLGVVERRHTGATDPGPADRVRIETRLCRSVDHVIATCANEVFELRRLGLTVDRTSIVPWGVDLSAFTPDGPPGQRRGARPRLLVLGSLARHTGVDEVIQAMRQVPDAELVVAGGPDADHLSTDRNARRLAASAVGAGVRDRVTFVGAVERDLVPRLMRSADIVLATPWYETFGPSALEAMACGVPVVATAVGGLTDIVIDGVTGKLVPPRDVLSIADAVNSILADSALAERLARASSERASRRYSWDVISRGILNAYGRAVGEPAADKDLDGEAATR